MINTYKKFITKNMGVLILVVVVFGIVAVTLWSRSIRTQEMSAALIKKIELEKMGVASTTKMVKTEEKTAVLAGGCFWCVESDFEKLNGVSSVVSGYSGGTGENPTYKNYGASGFREVVLVTYNPSIVDFSSLVLYLIKHSDVTDALGSFYDRGREYAPAVYYATAEEKSAAEKVIKEVNAMKVYDKPLALAVIPRVTFWPAEEYHQDYYKKNPIRYAYYRNASGRDNFIKKHWGDDTGVKLKNVTETTLTLINTNTMSWILYKKPTKEELQKTLSPLAYNVTQEDGTEKSFTSEYDKNYADGIYVDMLSGEPLYSSKDKFDSGTGWPSFVKPITENAVVLKEDKSFFSTRTEVRSKYSDSHLGHVFPDGPKDRGGLRYCMNGVALRFVPVSEMEKEGYSEYLQYVK